MVRRGQEHQFQNALHRSNSVVIRPRPARLPSRLFHSTQTPPQENPLSATRSQTRNKALVFLSVRTRGISPGCRPSLFVALSALPPKELRMSELSVSQSTSRAALSRKLSLGVFLLALVVGVVYVGSHLADDLRPVQLGSSLPYLLLGVALLIALGFEFVNGFHDTANAVA